MRNKLIWYQLRLNAKEGAAIDCFNLHDILAVAETGSFSKAAGKLFVSPVAVMNQMNELEGEVKAVLFVRTNRGVSLTRAGQMLQTKLLAIKKTN